MDIFRFTKIGDDSNIGKFEDWVAFYLRLKEASSKNFKINFTLGISGRNGNKEKDFEIAGESLDNGYGTPYLLKQRDLFNPALEYLVDGEMTIYCQVSDFYCQSELLFLLQKFLLAHAHCNEHRTRQQQC